MVTSLFPVTFGTVVVTSFLVVSALTDLTNVSVECVPNPVIAAAVPFAPTAVPLAVALMLVVDGVTVVVNVALLPKVEPVLGEAYPVTTEAVPSAPTAAPDAVALILVVVGVTVVVKVASLPRTLSVVPPVKVTLDAAAVNLVASPRTLSPVPLLRVTVSLYARVPRLVVSPNSIHLVPSKINSFVVRLYEKNHFKSSYPMLKFRRS